MQSWDVFISHASSDKEDFVLPLANALRNRGIRVWLDKWEISLGSSISESISNGLRESLFGIVVLSKAFFRGPWPQKELGALFAKENDGASYIIPIWHGVEQTDVSDNEPLLADRMAARSDEGIPSIVERVSRLIERGSSEHKGVTQRAIRKLTLKLKPDLPIDPFWETQLLADLDMSLYRSISDVELAYHRAFSAVSEYAREQPDLFLSGTDYITKALGFVDLCFRTRHNWASQTLDAFTKYSGKINWDI